MMVFLGESELLAGRISEAVTSGERALALVCQRGGCGNEARALSLLGNMAAQRNPLNMDLDVSYLGQAKDLAEELGL